MGAQVRLDAVTIGYTNRRGHAFNVVEDLTVNIHPGSIYAILGPSGSGKSSVLNAICGLVRPRSGSVFVDDVRVDRLTFQGACDLRRNGIGFVFQAFHLLPHLTASENAAIGALVRGIDRDEANAAADEALTQVGLAHRRDHKPAELSGGEQQRVALARVIAGRPALVLADEPTGNLDPAATEVVVSMLQNLRDITGATIVLASHSSVVADLAASRLALSAPGSLSAPDVQSRGVVA